MRNKIIATLIISLMLSQSNFAIVINNDGYKQKTNEEFVLKKDVLDYYEELQNWLDRDSKVELLRKVASRSELHGFYSESEIDWEHLYDDDRWDRKATRSHTS